MIIGFRQGVVRRQHDISGSPANLKKSTINNSIDLIVNPTQTVVTFTDGDRDYLYKFTKTVDQAWGPFSTSDDQHLMVDMNMGSGRITFASTIYPVQYSAVEPSAFFKRQDQHWYDIENAVMKVWRTDKWVPVLRVQLGIYRNSGSSIEYSPIGSPVSAEGFGNTVRSGAVIFDENGKPIRRRDGKFLTSEDTLTSHNAAELNSGFRIDQEYSKRVRSLTILPAFSCVSLVKDDLVYLSDYRNIDRVVSGVIVEQCSPGYDVQLLTYGRIFNPIFNFAESSIGKNVYTGQSGEITLTPPDSGLFQVVGTVYDRHSIFVNIQTPIELNTGAPSRPAYPPIDNGDDDDDDDVGSQVKTFEINLGEIEVAPNSTVSTTIVLADDPISITAPANLLLYFGSYIEQNSKLFDVTIRDESNNGILYEYAGVDGSYTELLPVTLTTFGNLIVEITALDEDILAFVKFNLMLLNEFTQPVE